MRPEPHNELTRSESAHIQREKSIIEQFCKIGIIKTNPLRLINDYLDDRLVSLEEALKPFDAEIDHLSYNIEEAKAKCHYPSEYKLTRDESASIYIYTIRWKDQCLYDHLQAAWRSQDRSKMKPWFKYLKLFKSALDKLPNTKGEIWQGALYDEAIKETLASESSSLYSTMTSCSPSNTGIVDYLQTNVGTKLIIVGFKSVNGKSLSDYTANQSKEVMLWPGIKLDVVRVIMVNETGSVIVHVVGQMYPRVSMATKPQIIEGHFECQNKGYRRSLVMQSLMILRSIIL
ncbi:unnamed protein product [Rotaria sordida]|uniref:NAD(+)--protein-arginine ADP-ribosyltransferase n=1 Tax=Rotaria sordida TaxID=392033 RepID=A0A815NGL9_9BILA|nr:unnamed protein product [Rotaria sordida]CAF1437456.1 unnamed protein product [Rotaria sordida]